jgi:DNA polymerase elongation subunit (family B)
MVVWLIESSQKRRRLIDGSFRPCFYVQGPEKQLGHLAETLPARAAVSCAFTERQNIWDRRMLRVLQVSVHHPTLFAPLTRFVRRFDSSLTLYDSDLMLASMYCWEKNVFPLARVEIEVGADGVGPGPNAVRPYITSEIRSITCRDDEWLTVYERPPVRTMRLRLEGVSDVNPKHGRHGSIEVAVEDDWQTLDDSDEPTAQGFERLLRVYDPDVLVTEWGDDVLLPGLLRQAQRLHIRLPLNRDALPVERTRSRSYMSYGRILFKESTTTLFGRLHIDTQNSFAADQCEMEGLWELVRVTKLPVQYACRTTPGTGISYMQMEAAWRDGVLIPAQKAEPESLKHPDELLRADRGGLVFPPRLGFFENVAELDFVSEFPSIMAKFNISPETINCPCCPQAPLVPELGYRVCQKHRGITSRVVERLIAKRRQYKEMREAGLEVGDLGLGAGLPIADCRLPIGRGAGSGIWNRESGMGNSAWQAGGLPQNLHLASESLCPEARAPSPLSRTPSPESRVPNSKPQVHGQSTIGNRQSAIGNPVPYPVSPTPNPACRSENSRFQIPDSQSRASLSIVNRQSSIGNSAPSPEPRVPCPVLHIPSPSACKQRRDVLKWLLVCCFGYTGYKNARFGKIEAHEAINALAREKLLVAKEAAEQHGFRVLHALVDSIYVQKSEVRSQEPGVSGDWGIGNGELGVGGGEWGVGKPSPVPIPHSPFPTPCFSPPAPHPQFLVPNHADYERLTQEIEQVTGLPLALEAVYRFAVFLPSRQCAEIPVPNRFFCVSEEGELKVRGLECRRHDTPPFVTRMQREVLAILAEARDFSSYCEKLHEAREVYERYQERLRDGSVAAEELVIRKRLTKAPASYQKNSSTAIAARQLDRAGVKLRPGENIEFIITDANASLIDDRVRAWTLWEGWRGYDAEAYGKALEKAFEPAAHFGRAIGSRIQAASTGLRI